MINETITDVYCNTCGQLNPVIYDKAPKGISLFTKCSNEKCGYINTLDNFVEHLKKIKEKHTEKDNG